MEGRLGANREIRRLAAHLWDGERVELMSAGTYGPGTGLVALTDRRLLFLKDGWTRQITEDFPMEKISSVQWSSGVLQGSLTVFASGNKAEIGNMLKKDGKAIADAIRGRLADRDAGQAASASAPTPTAEPGPRAVAPAGQSPIELLERLGQLREAGVVTDEEFEAKKAEILARL
ncbi:hypothetical protein E1289_07690 [Actinomadura sp. 6K520]|nr:hypothetical protein E1289_07690 [Actinomadura sp. 6K520]